MTTRDAIARQALALPPEDRAYVADLLEESLQECAFASQEIADAWSCEIDRRIQAYQRGETTPVDADVALQRMRGKVVGPVDLRRLIGLAREIHAPAADTVAVHAVRITNGELLPCPKLITRSNEISNGAALTATSASFAFVTTLSGNPSYSPMWCSVTCGRSCR